MPASCRARPGCALQPISSKHDSPGARARAGTRPARRCVIGTGWTCRRRCAIRCLRRWLRSIDMPEPNQYQVAELVRQLAEAGEDKLPCIRWPGAELRRYRDLVHALRPLHVPTADWQQAWDGTPLELPASLGTLRLVDGAGDSLPLGDGLHLHSALSPWRRSVAPRCRRPSSRTARSLSGSGNTTVGTQQDSDRIRWPWRFAERRRPLAQRSRSLAVHAASTAPATGIMH